MYKEQHVANSPYFINNVIQPEDCFCPNGNLKAFLTSWECSVTKQLKTDLNLFKAVDWNVIRSKVVAALQFSLKLLNIFFFILGD